MHGKVPREPEDIVTRSIVTYVHHYKRPKKKAPGAAIEDPAVVTVTDKERLKALREERIDSVLQTDDEAAFGA
jgi:hypothetical protein